jgi:acylphosphatase
MKIEAAHVFVSGFVQGVFYRSWAEQTARGLGLKGWVRNLPDGRVEAVFEGERSRVGKMLELCRKGPPNAKVDNVEARKEQASGFAGFEVRYSR